MELKEDDARQQAADARPLLAEIRARAENTLSPVPGHFAEDAQTLARDALTVLALLDAVTAADDYSGRIQELEEAISKLKDELVMVYGAKETIRRDRDEYERMWRTAKEALRKIPMPYRESTLGDKWDDAYDEWWHENASEEAILDVELGESTSSNAPANPE